MSLVPWRRRDLDDWSPIVSLQRQMNKLFDELSGGFDIESLGAHKWAPALDVAETEDAVVIKAELPGVDSKDVNISITGDVLTIKGEKKEETEEKQKNYHRVERSYGSFTRSVHLPSIIDADKVQASFKNGVLEVNLPKKEEMKPKTIQINVAE